MLTLGWALAAAVGSLAGMLVIPTELGLHPNAMDLLFISAFTAAVVGGLDSPVGAVVGGLVVGLLLSYVSGYLGATVAPMAVLVLLVVVLLGRPDGLFARGEGEDGMTLVEDRISGSGRRPNRGGALSPLLVVIAGAIVVVAADLRAAAVPHLSAGDGRRVLLRDRRPDRPDRTQRPALASATAR